MYRSLEALLLLLRGDVIRLAFFPAFEDPLADFLGFGFDLLHAFADSGARRFIPADCLIQVVFNFRDQVLQVFVFLHRHKGLRIVLIAGDSRSWHSPKAKNCTERARACQSNG
jgi:hypothetical protein